MGGLIFKAQQSVHIQQLVLGGIDFGYVAVRDDPVVIYCFAGQSAGV